MSDFDQIVESYLPAAKILGLDRADVECAVRAATRIVGRCPACGHSRAAARAVQVARDQGRLDVFNRSCSLVRPAFRCREFQPIELPPVPAREPAREEGR